MKRRFVRRWLRVGAIVLIVRSLAVIPMASACKTADGSAQINHE